MKHYTALPLDSLVCPLYKTRIVVAIALRYFFFIYIVLLVTTLTLSYTPVKRAKGL